MLPVGSIVSDYASGMGFLAATIAVCGFLGQALPALMRKDDATVRVHAVIGGLVGLVIAVGIAIVGHGAW